MNGDYKIITLCGSTKFEDDFLEVQKQLTLDGNIVVTPGVFSHSDGEVLTEDVMTMLEEMHKQKIDMADEVFVVNVEGYIGNSTRSEIEYAKSKGIPIRYLNEILSDTVQVVYCGDCKFFNPQNDNGYWGTCTNDDGEWRRGDYCSYGIRRGD